MHEVKFAVVREDPLTEARVLEEAKASSILLVASGGCTALSLKTLESRLEVVAYDGNPAQIAHVETKNRALASIDRRAFNVLDDDLSGLNQCGAFERLFRVLRTAFLTWVAPASEVEAFFSSSPSEGRTLSERWMSSPYWPAVFASVFHDPLLHAMFGPDATQHAPPGSYPAYFQAAFEKGFQRPDAPANPFLQHIFLGFYMPQDAPIYLRSQTPHALDLRLGGLPAISDLARFPVVHLSNIFDWCDLPTIVRWAACLQVLEPGALVIVRQLNHTRDLSAVWGESFALQDGLSETLTADDRSLFYNRIQIWKRR